MKILMFLMIRITTFDQFFYLSYPAGLFVGENSDNMSIKYNCY